MKKLMFAASAALIATVGLGVESGNVVGYAGSDLYATGSKMIAPTFFTAGGSTTFKLSELRGTGYEPYDDDEGEGGAEGEIVVRVLTSAGTVARDANERLMQYHWYDLGEFKAAGWYYPGGTTPVDADNVVLDVGTGLWVGGNSGLTLQYSGQVGTNNVAVPLLATGSKATGNMMAVNLKLSQIWGSGYDPYDDDEGEGGAEGEIAVRVLTPAGTVARDSDEQLMQYHWYDLGEFKAAGWYRPGGATPVDATNVTSPAGQGLWVSGDAGLYLNFTAPTL